MKNNILSIDKELQDFEKGFESSQGVSERENDNYTFEQKEFEWHLKRYEVGFTGSKTPNLMKQGRKKGEEWGATALEIILTLAMFKKMTSEGQEDFIREEMLKDFRPCAWGNKYEPEARDAYRAHAGDDYEVRETNFMVHPDIPYMGGSFDGEVFNKNGSKLGIIEIKCPYNPLNHEKNSNLAIGGLDESHTYYGQIQHNIEVAGVQWCDFVSYDPRMRAESKLAVIRVYRDEMYIEAMLTRIHQAQKILEAYLKGFTVKQAISNL